MILPDIELLGLRCHNCGFTVNDLRYRGHVCPKCSSPLLVDLKLISRDVSSIESLAPKFSKMVTLGEGLTPLIKVGSDYLKLEYLNPTGSFKDRGAALAISWVTSFTSEALVIEDSSGNAGLSVAAYSRRAGLEARIYVPSSIPSGKYYLLKALGAEVVKAGTRNEAHEAAIKDRSGYYVGHVTNPYFIEGIKDVALEIVKQLGNVPEAVIAPVASGTLILGLWKGFKELAEAGVISGMPKLVAVQAAGYASLSNLVRDVVEVGKRSLDDGRSKYADALRLTKVARLQQIARAVEESEGILTVVHDDAGIAALKELWRGGVTVEPSSAYAYAAYKKLSDELDHPVVTIMTGSGLKYVELIKELLSSNT